MLLFIPSHQTTQLQPPPQKVNLAFMQLFLFPFNHLFFIPLLAFIHLLHLSIYVEFFFTYIFPTFLVLFVLFFQVPDTNPLFAEIRSVFSFWVKLLHGLTYGFILEFWLTHDWILFFDSFYSLSWASWSSYFRALN